jgi:hypothetical protein
MRNPGDIVPLERIKMERGTKHTDVGIKEPGPPASPALSQYRDKQTNKPISQKASHPPPPPFMGGPGVTGTYMASSQNPDSEK